MEDEMKENFNKLFQDLMFEKIEFWGKYINRVCGQPDANKFGIKLNVMNGIIGYLNLASKMEKLKIIDFKTYNEIKKLGEFYLKKLME